VDVAITALRAELSAWLDHVRAGDEVIITERGIPVARLLPIDTAPLLDQLTQQGVLGKPRLSARPVARGTSRARASEPVSEFVTEQRR
jgi:prevent-host-death family protein